MNFNPVEIGYLLGTRFVPFLFAICFHEFAHGFVAKLYGDRTAERAGRLTLSPFAHGDLWGTFILPITSILTNIPLLGWAKPVPVDSRNMRNPKNAMFWTAAAGPLSNFLLAILTAIFLQVISVHFSEASVSNALIEIFKTFLLINLMLAIFNLIPVQPLDGGQLIERFLPYNANRWMQENQATISIALFFIVIMGGAKFLIVPVLWIAGNLLNLAAIFIH